MKELFVSNVRVTCFGMSEETTFSAKNIVPEIRGADSDNDDYLVFLVVNRVIL